jgi:hypothetical protein
MDLPGAGQPSANVIEEGEWIMKRFPGVMIMLCAALLLTGMGGIGGVPEGTIPEVKEDIGARLVDRSSTTTELTRISVDGNLFLEGLRGNGKVTIPLREVQRLEMTASAGENVTAQLQLRNQQKLTLTLRKRAVLYGDTGYGAYQILLRDVRMIEFKH